MHLFYLFLGIICCTYPQHPMTLDPIWRKIDLLVFHLAGSSQKTAGHLKKLQALSKHHGNPQQGKDIRATCAILAVLLTMGY